MNKEQVIYLALGSNLGDRQTLLERAIRLLASQIQIRQCSPVYETAPWGYADQANFLNIVLEASSELSPEEILLALKGIEASVGSKAGFKNGPREIDIDILFYGNEIIDEDNLVVPHPRLHERAFVLVPMLDLNAEFVHPELGKTIRQLAEAVDKDGVQRMAEMEPCAEIIAST
jgi:2-amino-4-hydroxy-6-hydroxymethyldihydropteridine diphosphokinase